MNRDKRTSGFTLIEVLIALVVLSIGLAAMIPMLLQSIRANSFGKSTTEAASLSQDMLEQLRNEPFQIKDPVTGVVGPNPKLTAGLHPDTTAPSGFPREWRVVDTGGAYSADVIGIEVTTTWTDAQGVPHPSRAFTVKSNL